MIIDPNKESTFNHYKENVKSYFENKMPFRDINKYIDYVKRKIGESYSEDYYQQFMDLLSEIYQNARKKALESRDPKSIKKLIKIMEAFGVAPTSKLEQELIRFL